MNTYTKEEYEAGKKYYENVVCDDRYMHCNRFESWSELSDTARENYIQKAKGNK